jgi:DNA-3-methyladenine glycosylase
MKRAAVSTPWVDRAPLAEVISRPAFPRAFYEHDTVEVAKALLGQVLVHGRCAGRIVEVEAYLGLEDRAAHAWRGLTERTKVLYGPAGHVYVYFIYGMYECLNLSADKPGVPGCVLIRALDPIAGIGLMKRRRPAAASVHSLCSGPGRLTLAMGITRKLYGLDATAGPLTVRAWEPVQKQEIASGPRIGIRECADWPLRFWIEGDPSVSRR